MLVIQSCPTLCDPMDCRPSGSCVHEIFQARILEWVAISFSRGSSPTQGSSPGLLHCRQILNQLSYKRSSILKYFVTKKMLSILELLVSLSSHIKDHSSEITTTMKKFEILNYQNLTQRHEVRKCCWKNCSNKVQ